MTGTQRIEHVVVLMLENRSFDHIFGYRTGLNGLGGDEYNLLDPTKAISNRNPAFYVSNGAPFAVPVGQGPGHSFAGATITSRRRKSLAENSGSFARGASSTGVFATRGGGCSRNRRKATAGARRPWRL